MSALETVIAGMARAARRASKFGSRLRAALSIRDAAPDNSTREAACIVDGDELAQLPTVVQRRALDSLAERLQAGNRSVLLLLDHAHAGAVDMLHKAQRCYAEQFKAGAVVIGIENIPRVDVDALAHYRRVAQAPVMVVDLRNADDVLRADLTLVATRVAGTLRVHG
jgi:hypothetical protein